jgi:hypothetical protein
MRFLVPTVHHNGHLQVANSHEHRFLVSLQIHNHSHRTQAQAEQRMDQVSMVAVQMAGIPVEHTQG